MQEDVNWKGSGMFIAVMMSMYIPGRKSILILIIIQENGTNDVQHAAGYAINGTVFFVFLVMTGIGGVMFAEANLVVTVLSIVTKCSHIKNNSFARNLLHKYFANLETH